MRIIIMLIVSNIFMTYAWYGHLRQTGMPLWKAILISWGIAFFEYCIMVPANRWGYQDGYNASSYTSTIQTSSQRTPTNP